MRKSSNSLNSNSGILEHIFMNNTKDGIYNIGYEIRNEGENEKGDLLKKESRWRDENRGGMNICLPYLCINEFSLGCR